jgi:Flp pilus assembly protein TadG
MMLYRLLKRFSKSDRGTAAIETAFILPGMLAIYFGLVDVTALISFNRKVTASASIMADLVAQERTSVLKAKIVDEYNAVAMVMSPTPMSDVHVDIYGFRNVAGTPTQIWKTTNGQGPSCGTVSTANMLLLMTATNDVIVAKVCKNYTPYVATFMGSNILGATTFLVSQTISVRPRSSLQLTCYNTTVVATDICT